MFGNSFPSFRHHATHRSRQNACHPCYASQIIQIAPTPRIFTAPNRGSLSLKGVFSGCRPIRASSDRFPVAVNSGFDQSPQGLNPWQLIFFRHFATYPNPEHRYPEIIRVIPERNHQNTPLPRQQPTTHHHHKIKTASRFVLINSGFAIDLQREESC